MRALRTPLLHGIQIAIAGAAVWTAVPLVLAHVEPHLGVARPLAAAIDAHAAGTPAMGLAFVATAVLGLAAGVVLLGLALCRGAVALARRCAARRTVDGIAAREAA